MLIDLLGGLRHGSRQLTLDVDVNAFQKADYEVRWHLRDVSFVLLESEENGDLLQ
jgi:hypothetical protein